MSHHLSRFLRDCALAMAATALAVGCATTGEGRSQTVKKHVPRETSRASAAENLQPHKAASPSERPRSATDLLKDAEQEFQTANTAQERGDYEAALRHYNKMLELLVEADLDPGIFYNLRAEFERILKGPPGSEQETVEAKLFEPRTQDWAQKALDDVKIEAQLQVPETLAQRVQAEIQEIQELYPRNFQYGLNRSAKYVPYIQEEMRKAGLPPDLAWLAMVESQFTPKIVSRAGAGGMWQFMKATGSRYGLRVDSYVDERYNWEKSTHAAIAYLKDLNSMFDGEWPLAVSAYNMGEGGMERALAMAGGERDLDTLISDTPAKNVIRTETKKFYPKLLASMIVAKDPERYGFKREPQAPDRAVRVPVQGCYSLAALDSACGLPQGTLGKLNQDLIRGVTPPTGQHAVAVPEEVKDQFNAALAKVPQERGSALRGSRSSGSKSEPATSRSSGKVKASGKTHTVKRGETLSSIARKYGVDVAELREANNVRSAHRLFSGTRLVIPGTDAAPKSEEPAAKPAPVLEKSEPAPKKSVQADEGRTYVVKRGDTLFEIAMREGLTVKQLQDVNGLKKASDLRVGQSLKLAKASGGASPAAAPSPVEKAVEKVTYKVQAGDFPAKIAQKHGVSTNDLLAWNGLKKNESIRVGQTLTICAPASGASAPKAEAPQATTHTVASGDTLGKIAERYGVSLKDLMAANNLKSSSVLRPGQKLVVKGGSSKTAAAAKNEPKKIVHKVTSGQNPTTIAKRYGVKVSDLAAWNGWKKTPTLQIGDELVILKK